MIDKIKLWRVPLAVVLSGLCLGLSQPLVIDFLTGSEPILGEHGVLGLLSLIGYAPVIYYLRFASVSRAFTIGFATSLIHFSIVFYWIVIACSVFGHIPLPLSILILLLLSGTVALYIASAFAVAQFLHLRFGFAHYFIVPAAVCAIEYLRNYGFVGGFPWGNVGYSISQVSVFLQSASVFGVYGLVFLVVMINALLANFARYRFRMSEIPKKQMVLFALLLIVPVAFGAWRLSGGFNLDGPKLKVALLQGNIEQGIKNQGALYANDILGRYVALQDEAVARGAQLVVWPESAYPETVANVQSLTPIGKAAPASVVGAVVYKDGWFHNSALVLNKDAIILNRYHKSHLVPFGEYVPWPFRSVVSKIVPGMGAFRPGNDYKPFAIKLDDGTELNLGLTICYEGVFPEITRQEALHGANLLVNLTNDAWYGVSSAPYQHLHMYRLRSVETGLPFVRATNTGVSAFVDAFGYVHDKTALYEKAMVLADVPLVKEHTLYMTLGDVVPLFSLVFVLLVLLFALIGKDVLVRRRAVVEWVLGSLGIALILWAGWHYADAKAALDESAITKQTFLSAYGFMVLVGAWSGRKFGLKLLLISSFVLMVLTFLIGLSEGREYWATTVLCAIVAAVGIVRKKAYR